MNIVFPELDNPIIKEAIALTARKYPDFSAIPADSLEEACHLAKSSAADALIAGIDYTTRDVVLACKDHLGTTSQTFSSCFVMQRSQSQLATQHSQNQHITQQFSSQSAIQPSQSRQLIIADAGVTKNPTADQLTDIVLQTYATASRVLEDQPRIAMLSFSTFGSAKDDSIDKIHQVIKNVRQADSSIIIDGEMQLDCAVNPIVAAKKSPGESPVAGRANVLITPDLNSGNILYKSLEQFGGYTAAGPILQGFTKPASDLSRGSTAADVLLVIDTIYKLAS